MDEKILNDGIEGNANPDPAEVSQDVAMPATEEKPTEPDGEFGDLPEAVSDRTKEQFEKLRKTNKELADKLKQFESSQYGDSVFDYLNGSVQSKQRPVATPSQKQQDFEHLSPGQVDQIVRGFVDQDGNVDINALNKALADANRRAKSAEQKASRVAEQVLRSEERRQVKEAHSKFPWLDPKNPSFDKRGFELVRDRVLRNMYENKEMSLTEVAEQISEFYAPKVDVSMEKEKAVSEYKVNQAKKAQASTVTTGKGQPRQDLSYEELRQKTLAGDTNSIDARLDMVTK